MFPFSSIAGFQLGQDDNIIEIAKDVTSPKRTPRRHSRKRWMKIRRNQDQDSSATIFVGGVAIQSSMQTEVAVLHYAAAGFSSKHSSARIPQHHPQKQQGHRGLFPSWQYPSDSGLGPGFMSTPSTSSELPRRPTLVIGGGDQQQILSTAAATDRRIARRRAPSWSNDVSISLFENADGGAMARTAERETACRQSPFVAGFKDSAFLQYFLAKSMNSWRFDAFLLNRVSAGRPVVSLAYEILHQYDIVSQLKLDPLRLLHCLTLIERGYLRNPFHNAIHAADVMQSAHCLLNDTKISQSFSTTDKLLCLFAALGHDLYHPGVNQSFLVRSKHYLSCLYETSVLENHHCRCFVSILRESHLLDHLPASTWKEYVDIFKALILSTDMQRQQEFLENFKTFLKSESAANVLNRRRLTERDGSHVPDSAPAFRALSLHYAPHETVLILQILLKCADISNVCRPPQISVQWSGCIAHEFYRQGDEEQRLGLEVTDLFSRDKTPEPKIQSGFMQFLAAPLFVGWSEFADSPLSRQLLSNLRANQALWDNESQKSRDSEQTSRDSSTSANSPKLRPLPEGKELSSVQSQASISSNSSASQLQHRKLPDTGFNSIPSTRRVSLPVPSTTSASHSSAEHNKRISLPATVSTSLTKWTIVETSNPGSKLTIETVSSEQDGQQQEFEEQATSESSTTAQTTLCCSTPGPTNPAQSSSRDVTPEREKYCCGTEHGCETPQREMENIVTNCVANNGCCSTSYSRRHSEPILLPLIQGYGSFPDVRSSAEVNNASLVGCSLSTAVAVNAVPLSLSSAANKSSCQSQNNTGLRSPTMSRYSRLQIRRSSFPLSTAGTLVGQVATEKDSCVDGEHCNSASSTHSNSTAHLVTAVG